MNNLETLEVKRQQLYLDYKKQQNKGIIFLVIAAAIALLSFVLLGESVFIGLIAAFAFAVVGFIFTGKAYTLMQSFRTIVKKDIILTLLKEQFDDVYYDPQGMIPISVINETRMVKRPDRFHGEDYIKGSYNGVNFELSDIDLKERVETRDSKGNVHVSYQTYFKGRWYIYQFPRKFPDALKIIEGRWTGADTRNMVKIQTESIEFNKKFSIYATTQEYGFYHITSSMIEKLLELEKLHRGSILYYYVGDQLHIGVNDRKDYMELSIKTPLNTESLKAFMSDIELIPAIINELRLDSQKFKNTI
jgi:hypothetical protein